MELSTKGRYTARAMIDLALHYEEAPVLLREIAERQQISTNYLAQLFVRLRAAGLVKSTRGAQGGFSLAKPPSQIKLSEVIQAVEGLITPVKCVYDHTTCERVNVCAPRDIWVEVCTAMNKVLESVTLQELIERQRDKENPKASMYYI